MHVLLRIGVGTAHRGTNVLQNSFHCFLLQRPASVAAAVCAAYRMWSGVGSAPKPSPLLYAPRQGRHSTEPIMDKACADLNASSISTATDTQRDAVFLDGIFF